MTDSPAVVHIPADGVMLEDALRRLRCETRLAIVPGATHLFEEPGTLEVVVRLATDWLRSHLGAGTRAA